MNDKPFSPLSHLSQKDYAIALRAALQAHQNALHWARFWGII